ncbi:MAG: NapC/NirT family cytochrome c [Bacillota bacterium]
MRWRWIVAGAVLVLAAGVLIYPLVATANDDVGFCLSCHVMNEQGKSYETSYHVKEATCSTCHTSDLAQKYASGARHVWANLTGHEEPIKLREDSRWVVAGNCAACHNPTSLHSRTKQQKGENCLECHKGHDPKAVHVNGFGAGQ